MKEISIKKYIRYLFGVAILVFFLNKFILRPWVLENEMSELFQIIVLSVPNLIEAIVGTLLLTGILLQMKHRFNNKLGHIKDEYFYLFAVGLASIYSVSQEFKFHNLGGNNVYDPYDVIASLIGLGMTYAIIQVFGFVEMVKTE
jgi:hypothetical protein